MLLRSAIARHFGLATRKGNTMARNSRIPNWIVGMTLASSCILTLILRSARMVDPDPSSLIKSRFLKRSERIFRKITGARGDVTTSIVLITGRRHNGSLMPELARIKMLDDSHNAEVVLDWETATGELNRVSSRMRDYYETEYSDLGKRETSQVSLHWLTVLGIASDSPLWKQDAEPNHASKWLTITHWSAPDRTAAVTIHAQTGELSNIQIERVVIPRRAPALLSQSTKSE